MSFIIIVIPFMILLACVLIDGLLRLKQVVPTIKRDGCGNDAHQSENGGWFCCQCGRARRDSLPELDKWGKYVGIEREENEPDADYLKRIILKRNEQLLKVHR